MVGTVPYASDHQRRVTELARADSRVRLLGGVWDQDLLDTLYAGSASYLHGHSVGGTNPSLLRAMGAAANVIAWEVNFNREVLADTGQFFGSPEQLAPLVEAAEQDPVSGRERGVKAQHRAADTYRWDSVTDGYEQLCDDLRSRVRCRRTRRTAPTVIPA